MCSEKQLKQKELLLEERAIAELKREADTMDADQAFIDILKARDIL